MDVFNILNLIGGLALFLYGMHVMGEGLEKRAGSKLKDILERMTNNPLKGILLGAGVTAIIQSSSATTVMVVGFVNSGVMKLSQALSVIMGANIGTTITAWIIGLTGLDGESLIIQLFKPSSFSPVFALLGIALLMFSKRSKKRDIGTILIGFAVLMFGMIMMSSAVKPLADEPAFVSFLTLFENPLFGILAGVLVTAIIQSSSASVGILQALALTGTISYGAAIPIILGQNIGTCVTALLSSIGTNKNAKRAALMHLYFSLIGKVLFYVIFLVLDIIFKFEFMTMPIDAWGIAFVHSIYNVGTTFMMLPFMKQLEHLAFISIKDSPETEQLNLLDQRLLATPSIAINQAKKLANDMGDMCRTAIASAVGLTTAFDEKTAQSVRELEKRLDIFEDKIGAYLVDIAGQTLSDTDSREVTQLMHGIGDYERIGDHALNILEAAEEMHDKGISFSDEAQGEISHMEAAVHDVLDLAVEAFKTDDMDVAVKVEPLEQVVDYLKLELKTNHVLRLQRGDCTIELGFIFNDLVNNFERIADHCSNIAVAVLQYRSKGMESHKYMETVKAIDNREFMDAYEAYKEKYDAMPDGAAEHIDMLERGDQPR